MTSASNGAPTTALVLGIGNVLWADEGFGVRAVEALHERYALPETVSLVDGGTQGLVLLADVTAHPHVLVFDAVDFGDAPGTLRVLRDREVPSWAGAKMSLHQQSFMELLAVADLQGRFPPHLTLIGVQPERLMDFGGSLTDIVRAQIAPAIAHAVAQLTAWGFAPQLRSAPPAERLNDHALHLDAYEGGRPAADEACRVGDARFLALRASIESGAAANLTDTAR
ncbi:MAG: HyaD/HybD family hydrogenase maturation endopeptidase [Burkholderiaceae bacterium]|nr:HyaD/HybD family hydrogenase maturation endopeptidase [Burkholderiaceae bacterium]